jgi:iron complex transport system permease protein
MTVEAPAGPQPVVSRRRVVNLSLTGGLVLTAGATIFVCLLSLRIGSLGITTADALNALFNYDPESYEQTVVRSLRLPRTIIGIGVGAALAVSGAVMQAATRNPLAGPGILGVSSGASFAIVTAIYFGHLTAPIQYVWFAFVGGLATSALVYAVGTVGAGGASPVKLALAGVIVSALLSSWTTALLLLDQETLDVVRFWSAGSLAGRDLEVFWTVLPFLAIGGIGAMLITHQLNILSLGDDAARALGMQTGRMRLVCALLVVLMTGAAVAAAGPIGFVGLAVPHIVRAIVGPDNRWVVPYSALVGVILLLGADVLGRVLLRPSEIQVGIITAATGAPFLIWIARSRRVADL